MKKLFNIILNGLGLGINGIFGPKIIQELNIMTQQKYNFHVEDKTKTSAKIIGKLDKESIAIEYEFNDTMIITKCEVI